MPTDTDLGSLAGKAAALRAEITALTTSTATLEQQLEKATAAEGHSSVATVQAQAAVQAAKVASQQRAEALAREAEALDKQAQAQESSSGSLMRFVSGAATQARAALQSLATGAVAAAGAVAGIAMAGAAAEQHARAVTLLGDAYQHVQQQTAGTVAAEQALRAQQELTQSGYRVTGEQLGIVARAAREYAMRTGGDAAQATEGLTQALITGEAGGLRRYGITVDSTRGRVANYHSALRQLATQQQQQGISSRTQAEELEALGRTTSEFAGRVTGLLATYRGWLNQNVSLADGIRELNDLLAQGPGGLEAQQARERARLAEREQLVRRFRELGGTQNGYGGITNSMDNAAVRRLIADIERTGHANEQAAAAAARLAQERRQAAAAEQAAQHTAEQNDHSRDQQHAQAAEQARDRAAAAVEAERRLADVRRDALYLGAELVQRTRLAGENDAQAAERLASAQAERNAREQQYISLLQQARAAVQGAAREESNRRLVRPYEDALRNPGNVAELERRAQEVHGRIEGLLRDMAPLARAVANHTATRADTELLDQLNAQTGALRQQEQQLVSTSIAQRRLQEDWRRSSAEQDRRSAEDRASRQGLSEYQRGLHGEGIVDAASRVTELEARLRAARQAADEAAERFNRTGSVDDGREADMLRRRADIVRDLANSYRDMAEAQRDARDVGLQTSSAIVRSLQLQTTAAQQWGSFTESSVNAATGAFKSHFQALITGKESAAQALEGMLADTLQSLATESAVRALFMTAKGVADAASGNYVGAAEDFTSAGLFAAVAALAGAGSYGLSQASKAPSSAAASAPPSAQGPGQQASSGRSPRDQVSGPVIIKFSSNNVLDDRDTIRRHLVGAIVDARRQGVHV